MVFGAESAAYVAAAPGVEHPAARDYRLARRGLAEQLRASLADIRRIVLRVPTIVAEPEAEEAARAA